MAEYAPGDRVIWYDYRLWGPKDIGNNDHCRKPGTILRCYTDEEGRPAIDILFDHNPNVSHGHFAYPPFEGTTISRKMPGGHCGFTSECQQICLCGCSGCSEERE